MISDIVFFFFYLAPRSVLDGCFKSRPQTHKSGKKDDRWEKVRMRRGGKTENEKGKEYVPSVSQ